MATRMHRLLVTATVLGLAGVYGAASASASASTPAVPHGVSAAADSLTGCLQKGTKSGQYTLRTSDGKEYQLTSKSVPLSKHVGHEVSVEGTAASMSAGQTAGDTGAAAQGGMGAGMMNVTKLTHVAAKCQ